MARSNKHNRTARMASVEKPEPEKMAPNQVEQQMNDNFDYTKRYKEIMAELIEESKSKKSKERSIPIENHPNNMGIQILEKPDRNGHTFFAYWDSPYVEDIRVPRPESGMVRKAQIFHTDLDKFIKRQRFVGLMWKLRLQVVAAANLLCPGKYTSIWEELAQLRIAGFDHTCNVEIPMPDDLITIHLDWFDGIVAVKHCKDSKQKELDALWHSNEGRAIDSDIAAALDQIGRFFRDYEKMFPKWGGK